MVRRSKVQLVNCSLLASKLSILNTALGESGGAAVKRTVQVSISGIVSNARLPGSPPCHPDPADVISTDSLPSGHGWLVFKNAYGYILCVICS